MDMHMRLTAVLRGFMHVAMFMGMPLIIPVIIMPVMRMDVLVLILR